MAANRPPPRNGSQTGFSLLEVLITIVIVAIGLLGLAGLQARAVTSEFESYQRSQAILIANDMVERIRMNRVNKGSFKSLTDFALGTPYFGTAGADSATVSCSSTNRSDIDLCDWDSILQGSSERKSGTNVGAMTDARGCITYDESTELPGGADTGLFTVSVAWKGSAPTTEPTVNCANGLYGSETYRRVVSLSFRFAKLD